MLRRTELLSSIPSNADTIDWCRRRGLLLSSIKCPVCNNEMKEVADSSIDGWIWKCSKVINGVRHYKRLSIRHNSFFSGSRLAMRDFVCLIYEWAILTSVEQCAFQLAIPKKTVRRQYRLCRKVISTNVDNRLIQLIGGPGQRVEIDECQIGRRKHHRGRAPSSVWVFGAIVRSSVPPICSIDIVKKRDKATLTQAAESRIHAGSDIISDGWAAYSDLSNHFHSHRVVNHSENFLSPTDPMVHTQNIENLWKCLRKFLTTRNAYKRRHLEGYIKEFIYRKSSPDPFECFISELERKLLH